MIATLEQRKRTQATPSFHESVLVSETLEALAPGPSRRYLDCTLGGGGHAAALLAASSPDGRVLGIDRDASTLPLAIARLSPYGDRFVARHAAFANLTEALMDVGWTDVDGILFDLGFSSVQLEDAARGLSFLLDGPLDMRLDPTSDEPTVLELLADFDEETLANVLYKFGEEPASRKIAREVMRRRRLGKMQTTSDLRAAVLAAVEGRSGRLDPATRTFQALRIAVNDEIGQLERALPRALAALAPGGRLVVISFHSLEDRLVKQVFARASANCVCPPELPECRCGGRPSGRVLWRKPRVAGQEERQRNPRSRSAKLRAFEKASQVAES